ncbi:MAG TPA: UdgX family uracil-DNA binding protein [Rugosimonospora sp.]|nr:UdgX family uracil-DNA binding protein [Rugosimonospora sp.]
MTKPATSAAPFVPDDADLAGLREAARGCQGCHLYADATQTVFSRGGPGARMVLVGEQPGDVEDQRGEPFVGPAGVLLRRATGELGLEPRDLYITNAVKHFKFSRTGTGKRRIHQTPDRIEIMACRPWLLAEFAQLAPRVVVALGATAGQALLGPSFRVTRMRGQLLPWPESAYHPEDFAQPGGVAKILATLHPSAVLRADDREAAYAGFLADLRVAAAALY